MQAERFDQWAPPKVAPPPDTSVAIEESEGYSSNIMIWIGRLISVPVGILFFLFLVLTLVLVQVNDTFLNPGFYTRQLASANLYELALNELLTSALDEARELEPDEFPGNLSGEIDENPLVTSGLSTQRIVEAINRAVPPEYVQDLVEQSFDEVGRYVTGERDEFTFTVMAGEQVATMVDEVKALLREADAYDLFFERAIEPAVRDAVEIELPLGVEVSSDRLVEAVGRIVTSEWVREQVEAVLDQATPYLIGETESFEIRFELADRVEIALREVKDILREIDGYELLYVEVVEPEIRKILGDVVDLPFGLSVSNEEVVSSLRKVAPPDWVQEQVERVIDDVGPYLTGRTDGFSTEVSLVENKRLASEIIADLVDRKLIEAVDGLPTCETPAEALPAARAVTDRLPPCIPVGTFATQLIESSGIDVTGTIQRFILGPIPDEIRFTDSQIRSALRLAGDGDNLESVDKVREVLRDGWTYTEVDLEEDLRGLDEGEEIVETLNDIRSFLADGWTYTHLDLQKDLEGHEVDSSFGAIDTAQDVLERVRDGFKLSRQFRWVIYLPIILLLVMIGFLGGRGWGGRVIWAASFLLISAGVVFIATGPVYSSVANVGFDEARQRTMDEIEMQADDRFPNTSRLAADKGFDMAESVTGEFVAGVRTASLNLAIAALLAIVVTVFWGAITGSIRSRWRGRRA